MKTGYFLKDVVTGINTVEIFIGNQKFIDKMNLRIWNNIDEEEVLDMLTFKSDDTPIPAAWCLWEYTVTRGEEI